MPIYFHSCLCSYLSRVANIVEDTVYIYIYILFFLFYFFTIFCSAIENDRDFKMCGIWHHDNASRNLKYDLKTGCKEIEISANESTLSVRGSITAKCTQSSSIPLELNPLQNQSHFCVFWEPLLDLMIVEVNGKNHTLCESHGLQGTCCTDLSQAKHESAALYGIVNGSVHGDLISYDVMKIYNFKGDSINCSKIFRFCCLIIFENYQKVTLTELTCKFSLSEHV